MLYFAYGINLNHLQMKRRCKDSVFLKKINLKNFRLTFRSKYRAADIEKKIELSKSLFLFDIEGDEFDLLNNTNLNILRNSFLIIEIHHFYSTPAIVENFEKNLKKLI